MQNKELNVGRVLALRDIRTKCNEIERVATELSKPLLEDLSLLPVLYDAYCEVYAKRGYADAANLVVNRRKFLMVVLYMYCPSALIGGRMRPGLRQRLSEIFGINCASAISDNCAGLLSCYQHYRDFRQDVGVINRAIHHKLSTYVK